MARPCETRRAARLPRRTGVGAWAGLALLIGPAACVPIPVRVAPAVAGTVVDEVTGAPIPGALVVVRFDGRHNELLPDRELLGHLEARSDEQGRFQVGPLVRPGLAAWPHFGVETRVAGALREGYRCSAPLPVPASGAVTVRLAPALEPGERQESCRPIAARRGEAAAYRAAWRALYPEPRRDPALARDPSLERTLAARAALGFGENCEGPVLDLALAPGGTRAAFVAVGEGAEPDVYALELSAGARRSPALVGRARRARERRLAWASPFELVLWEPASARERAASPELAEGRFEVIWSGRGAPATLAARTALEPVDLHDERDAHWLGRSFDLVRSLDPTSGLPFEHLVISRPDGRPHTVPLPGESCARSGRFGRPQDRITADGRTGLDLRFVEGGCHAVEIDLESGEWWTLDRSAEPARCREARRIPAAHLTLALRGYVQELEAALRGAGADPGAAYALQIEAGGEATLAARDTRDEPRTVAAPHFPLRTPLRRIDVSLLAGARPAPAAIADPNRP